jgi:hypothetical protein
MGSLSVGERLYNLLGGASPVLSANRNVRHVGQYLLISVIANTR